MEKFWKKASQSEYQKCFDILNTHSLIETETYKKFAMELFEIAKNQLDCKDCKLKFVEEMKNNLGVASVDNTITLNLSKMEKQTLFKTVSTIYHELTHIHQHKTSYKKVVNSALPAQFPYVHCLSDERFLPAEMLGIKPFLFYYTSQQEKEARDVGSECAMDLFVALKKIAQTQPTKNGTIRLIERCIEQVQARWDKENADNSFATLQLKIFLLKNPNFVENAVDKAIQEFYNDVNRNNISPNQRVEFERRFNFRIGTLVLMGCDEKVKNKILNFIFKNFISRGEMFTALISVFDSPYCKVTKNDLDILFKLAAINKCPKETLFKYLGTWDKNCLNEMVKNSPLQPSTEHEL